MSDGLGLPDTLLPHPKRFRRLEGSCAIDGPLRVVSEGGDPRLNGAVERLNGRLLSLHRASSARRGEGPPVKLALRVDPTIGEHRDTHRLAVRTAGIEIVGRSAAACFHGLQTLGQMLDAGFEADGGRAPQSGGATEGVTLPCCIMEDWPEFAMRGLLHDVTRGKVPTLDTLKHLADRLAGWKVNQLQLYIEHAFVFSFDGDICDADHGLTDDEVRSLDEYCAERFIDLVPAVATFGHMGRILSLPAYGHLAEIEAAQPWSQMSWPQRARGLTLDCLNPASRRLVERIWSDVLGAFRGKVVNICGDEPWDLGLGRNRDRLPEDRRGQAYLEHIRWTHDLCVARGRRVQIWSDVVCRHRDLFHLVPREALVLHWGYDDEARYGETAAFVAAGLDTVVCPGTSGWKRIVNAINLAERNISRFAAAGRRHGAMGLLNTDWGDHGHLNALACSWHGIALGAVLAWQADHPIGRTFDESLARKMFGERDASLFALLRRATDVAGGCETWRMMWMPVQAVREDATLPSMEAAEAMATDARAAAAWLEEAVADRVLDRRELLTACRLLEVFADRVRAIRTSNSASAGSLDRGRVPPALIEEVKENWLAGNKRGGLSDIVAALEGMT